jgi:hypothetical protein
LYDTMFGLPTAPIKEFRSQRPTPLPVNLAGRLLTAAAKLKSGDVPKPLLGLIRGRTTHPDARKARLKFLKDQCGK